MDSRELQYLEAINQQLGGTIRAAITDRLTRHLLSCTHRLLTRLIIQARTRADSMEEVRHLRERISLELEQVLAANRLDASRPSGANVENGADAETQLAQAAGCLASSRDSQSQKLLRELVEHDARRWDEVQNATLLILQQAAERVDREVEALDHPARERLVRFLQLHCGESTDLRIARVNAVPGGFSKQTIIVDLENNHALPASIVLRRDRAESPAGSTVRNEFPLLHVLHQHDIKVPKPWAMDDSALTGHPTMVVSRVDGDVIGDVYDIFEPAGKQHLSRSLARELAKIHRIPVDRLPPTIPGMDEPTGEFQRKEIETFLANWRRLKQPSIIVEAAFHWLLSHLQFAEGERSLVHRDTRFHNILTDSRGVAAVLDWEMAVVGNPARDLSWAYHHIVQIDDWRAFLTEYECAGGIIPTDEQLNFYLLWADLWNCMFTWQAQAIYLSGATDNIQIAYAGEHMRERNMHIVAQRLRHVLDHEKTRGA